MGARSLTVATVLFTVTGHPRKVVAQELVQSATAIDKRGNIQPVDVTRFRQSHAFTLLVTEMPTSGDGQIPSYGGPFQKYLNVAGAYRLSDVKPPFGASGVMPVARRRVELSGSIGGLYVPFRSSYTMPNAWLTQAALGARIALDQKRHFWVGGTARYLTNFADRKRQWGDWSADFTVQSGH